MGKPQAQHRKHHALRKRYIRIEGWKTFQESKSNGTEEDASEKEKDAEEAVSVTYRKEKFGGYNKPKRTPGKSKKFAVLAKEGDKVRLVRFGDPNMKIRKSEPARRKSFRARHKCDQKKSKLTAGYWSCKKW